MAGRSDRDCERAGEAGAAAAECLGALRGGQRRRVLVVLAVS